jgi:hypothetical protein
MGTGFQSTAEQARTQLQAHSQGRIFLAWLDARLAASRGQLVRAREHYIAMLEMRRCGPN